MKICRSVILLAALVLVAGVVPSAAADEPYEFYAILALTGQGAFLGHDQAPVFGAVERYVNSHGGIRGRTLHVNILDDGSNPATSVQIANQLIAKHVPAFVGPTLGATCSAVDPLIEQNGPVMYCLSAVGHPAPKTYAFISNVTNRDALANVFRFLKAKGVRRLGLLETTDSTGSDAVTATQDALQDRDLSDVHIVATERYGTTDISVTAQVSRLKAAGVDAISNYVTGGAFGTALRAIRDVGFEGWVFSSAANASRDQMKNYGALLPDKLIFNTLGFQMQGILPSGVRVAKANYLESVHQVGIFDPTIGNALPWDPMMIIVSGLRTIGPNATAKQLRDFMVSLHDWPGINGMYDFRRGDQRGIDPKSTGVMRYDRGSDQFVVLSRPGGQPF